MEWLTLLAIIVGPIAAVTVTRVSDRRRENHTRRMDVFKTLMRTRRTPVYPEHVGALNLIELEFAKDPDVMDAWRVLFKHFGTTHPRRDDEAITPAMDNEEKGRRDARFFNRLNDERHSALTRLLHSMAKALRFQVEQLEIFEGGYTPQGWYDVEVEQTAVRRFFLDLGMGRRLLPIAVFDYIKNRTEDPAPSAEGTKNVGGE
jgi:hypothetical protein